MLGPKLDARSYAILVLAAIALVLSSTLVAQQFDLSPTSPRSAAGATADVASANREIARALQEIARSNKEIADSIVRLSRSVGEIKDAIGDLQGEVAEAQPAAPPERAVDDRAEGVFELGN